MSSALADPPDSGVKKAADATPASASTPRREAANAMVNTRRRVREWASAKAGGILFMRRPSALRPASRPRRGPSAAPELGLALLEERGDAFGEVAGLGHLLLHPGLELELLLQSGVKPGVELALGAGVGPCGPGREAPQERTDRGLELVVGDDLVDEP